MIDCDNSGLISYTEFAFFLVFTQMPENIVRRKFKKQTPTNSISRDEFAELIEHMSRKTNKKKQEQVKLDARLVSATDEEWAATNKKLCEHIFKDKTHITF